MPSNVLLMTLIRFLHDLATAVWIGGLFAMGLAVLPALRKGLGAGPEARRLTLGIQKRLRVPVFASIAVLIVTGALMARRSPQFLGLLRSANLYSAVLAGKHVLVIAMVLIALVRGVAFGRPATKGLSPAGASAPVAAEPGPRERTGMVLLLLNILLGIAVLFLSALNSIISDGGPQ